MAAPGLTSFTPRRERIGRAYLHQKSQSSGVATDNPRTTGTVHFCLSLASLGSHVSARQSRGWIQAICGVPAVDSHSLVWGGGLLSRCSPHLSTLSHRRSPGSSGRENGSLRTVFSLCPLKTAVLRSYRHSPTGFVAKRESV